MNELDVLHDEEQSLHVALKAVRLKRESALAAIASEEALEAELRRQEVAAKAAALKEYNALGVSYAKLRSNLAGEGLRVVYVHKDIRALLIAALPAVDEQQFLQLVSTVIERLASGHTYIKKEIDTLRDDEDMNHYFQRGANDVSVTVALSKRFAGGKSELLSDYLTAYGLAWGKLSNYEGQE